MSDRIRDVMKEGVRGLALIMYNTYTNDPKIRLINTEKDGRAMENTFKSLKFATLVLPNASKDQVSNVVDEIASFPDYPEKYNCFAVYFSGHGNIESTLLSNESEPFNFEKVILQRFNKKLRRNVSERITQVPILVFIDACKGEKWPYPKGVAKVLEGGKVPMNVLVSFATAEGYVALENGGGGVWTQQLASRLEISEKSIVETLKEVKEAMPKNYFREALPVTWTKSNVGDFKLKENVDGGGEFEVRQKFIERESKIRRVLNKIKDILGLGTCAPSSSSWIFSSEEGERRNIDAILGHRPASVPSVLLDAETVIEDGEDPELSINGPKRKRKRSKTTAIDKAAETFMAFQSPKRKRKRSKTTATDKAVETFMAFQIDLNMAILTESGIFDLDIANSWQMLGYLLGQGDLVESLTAKEVRPSDSEGFSGVLKAWIDVGGSPNFPLSAEGLTDVLSVIDPEGFTMLSE